MSMETPYVVSDEEDYEVIDVSDDEIELLDFRSLDLKPEIVAASPAIDPSAPPPRIPRKENCQATLSIKQSICAPDTEIQRFKLSKGCIIRPGDTVELKEYSTHASDTMHSADFLRIKHIIMDLETDEVRLRGHRLRRTKYLGQIFDWKLNELSMVLRVREDDTRCPFVAGMEDIPVSEVLRPRECVLSNKPYPLLSFRDGPRCAFPPCLSKEDIKQQIFQGGRLVCRVVNIVITSMEGKPYSGIVRHLHRGESDPNSGTHFIGDVGLSEATSISIDINTTDKKDSTGLSSQGKRRGCSDSAKIVETVELSSQKKSSCKQKLYVFGDVFCGAGGASQGAQQAGLYVAWGLDHDELACEAYLLNHPNARAFRRDAHDFPPEGRNINYLRIDVLHLSPPCCYFSPAHTRPGPNDQLNMEALYTVGPTLERLRPRVATLEQTYGLSTYEQHKANFFMLLHDITRAGYDLKYKIQDISDFGLSQRRVRLLIIAARRGTPLPPFPIPTHGPAGTGLKPYNDIKSALLPMQGLGYDPDADMFHQPKLFDEPRAGYDAHTLLKACITTSGCSKPHYSGTRNYTPRELSLFQSFPLNYQFTGGRCEANKQIGNAFPPVMAEALYRTIAKTLEAFDHGLVGVEDDLRDLDAILIAKGVGTRPQAVHGSIPDRGQAYRYLTMDNIDQNAISAQSYLSPFARNKDRRVQTQNSRTTSSSMHSSDAARDESDEEVVVVTHHSSNIDNGRQGRRTREYDFGDQVIILSESEGDSD